MNHQLDILRAYLDSQWSTKTLRLVQPSTRVVNGIQKSTYIERGSWPGTIVEGRPRFQPDLEGDQEAQAADHTLSIDHEADVEFGSLVFDGTWWYRVVWAPRMSEMALQKSCGIIRIEAPEGV